MMTNEMINGMMNDEELDEISGGKVYGNGDKQKVIYVVKRGDTLNRIAKKYNTTWRAIKKLNPMIRDPHWIRTGWVLTINANAA